MTYQEANGAPGESHVFVQFVEGGIAPLKLGPRDADASVLTTVEHVPIEARRVDFACGPEPFDGAQRALADQLDREAYVLARARCR